MIKKLDPRTKLLIIIFISTLAIIFNSPQQLLILFFFNSFVLMAFQINIFSVISRLRRFLPIVVMMVFIQSIFTTGGEVLLSLGEINVLTTNGVKAAVCILLRMLILFASAMIIMTSSSRDYVLALVQLKVPYEIAFMVLVGLRFLPLFIEEIKDNLIAIQLRGVDLKKIPWGNRLKVYTALFAPLIAGTINKANQLAITMEARAFRAYPRRTYIRVLKFQFLDYVVTLFLLISTISLFIQFGDKL